MQANHYVYWFEPSKCNMFQMQEKDKFSFCLYFCLFDPYYCAPVYVYLCKRFFERIFVFVFYLFRIGRIHSNEDKVLVFSAIFGWFNEFGMYLFPSFRLALVSYTLYSPTHHPKQYISKTMDADNCILFEQHFVLYVTFFSSSFFQTNFDLVGVFSLSLFLVLLFIGQQIFQTIQHTHSISIHQIVCYSIYDK